MKFSEIVEQASDLLRRKGRVSYRALKIEFDLDDDRLDVLKEELLYAYPQIVDDEGRGLIWNGETEPAAVAIDSPLEQQRQTPVSYTPSHLAERILAEQAAMESRGANVIAPFILLPPLLGKNGPAPQTLGWVTSRAMRASLRKRASHSGFMAIAGLRNLSAIV